MLLFRKSANENGIVQKIIIVILDGIGCTERFLLLMVVATHTCMLMEHRIVVQMVVVLCGERKLNIKYSTKKRTV